jgi:hypothetical protein
MCIDKLLNVDIYNLVHTTHLWNSIHQICSNSKPDKKKCLGERKPKGLSCTDKIKYGHLCLREENLSFSKQLHDLGTVNFNNKHIL